ncbi:MAG: peroxidase [candidate division Zixibacteria bacterium]|nr:peroxidase [candidate division Zixibacteria bacterium]
MAEQETLIDALTDDYTTARITPADRAMLDYAAALTRAPSQITQENIDALRTAGFDDRGIHDICAVTAYYAFVNRIADGLGVELE